VRRFENGESWCEKRKLLIYRWSARSKTSRTISKRQKYSVLDRVFCHGLCPDSSNISSPIYYPQTPFPDLLYPRGLRPRGPLVICRNTVCYMLFFATDCALILPTFFHFLANLLSADSYPGSTLPARSKTSRTVSNQQKYSMLYAVFCHGLCPDSSNISLFPHHLISADSYPGSTLPARSKTSRTVSNLQKYSVLDGVFCHGLCPDSSNISSFPRQFTIRRLLSRIYFTREVLDLADRQ
jgi:hypothetical protein